MSTHALRNEILALVESQAFPSTPEGQMIFVTMENLMRDFDRANEAIRSHAEQISRTLARTIEAIDGGRNVNELGELNGSSVADFNRACTQRQQAASSLRVAATLLSKNDSRLFVLVNQLLTDGASA